MRGGGQYEEVSSKRRLRDQLEIRRSNGLLGIGCLIVKTIYSIFKNTVIYHTIEMVSFIPLSFRSRCLVIYRPKDNLYVTPLIIYFLP